MSASTPTRTPAGGRSRRPTNTGYHQTRHGHQAAEGQDATRCLLTQYFIYCSRHLHALAGLPVLLGKIMTSSKVFLVNLLARNRSLEKVLKIHPLINIQQNPTTPLASSRFAPLRPPKTAGHSRILYSNGPVLRGRLALPPPPSSLVTCHNLDACFCSCQPCPGPCLAQSAAVTRRSAVCFLRTPRPSQEHQACCHTCIPTVLDLYILCHHPSLPVKVAQSTTATPSSALPIEPPHLDNPVLY